MKSADIRHYWLLDIYSSLSLTVAPSTVPRTLYLGTRFSSCTEKLLGGPEVHSCVTLISFAACFLATGPCTSVGPFASDLRSGSGRSTTGGPLQALALDQLRTFEAFGGAAVYYFRVEELFFLSQNGSIQPIFFFLLFIKKDFANYHSLKGTRNPQVPNLAGGPRGSRRAALEPSKRPVCSGNRDGAVPQGA
ncbi:hypothetical protein NDU88_006783 [Pleurodeles waltl]|uniref:Uncharacterized protein n=1 Tax=Pleurodeles waltl TaxID=8319 RepID=A0AAV7TY61_PLEWA|nr:hypothetical protein NDU88_006783 [Pleurodeles waltl]